MTAPRRAMRARPRPTDDGWVATWWRSFYAGQVVHAKRDLGLPHHKAEAYAFGLCVTEWLIRRPERSAALRCAACDADDLAGDPLLPFGNAKAEVAWLHLACWPAWHAGRVERAVMMLVSMGINRSEP